MAETFIADMSFIDKAFMRVLSLLVKYFKFWNIKIDACCLSAECGMTQDIFKNYEQSILTE